MKTPNPSKKASPKPREGNGETLDRDNPVPSIDDLIRKFAEENPDTMIEVDPWNVLEDFAKFYKSQNGVETNKVQPITIAKCICDEPICKCSFF